MISPGRRSAVIDRLLRLARARDGRLTRELKRVPGGFGLGQVLATKTPDATPGMVCGFCSTGCGLTVHLRDGEAIRAIHVRLAHDLVGGPWKGGER